MEARHSRLWQDGCETIPFESFAASIRKLALEQGTYTPLTSPEGCSWVHLFNDCLGNTEDSFVKAQYHSLKLARPDPSPIQPLAVLAFRAQRAPLVEWCLQQGAVVDRHFAKEAIAMPSYDAETCTFNDPAMGRALAPDSRELEEQSRGWTDPDGSWTAEQIDEWHGDIRW